MQPTIRLVDPQGRTQATLKTPATPEDLLSAAFDLGPGDGLVVCTVGPAQWSLAIYRAGKDTPLIPVGPSVGEISRNRWESMRTAMAETAWLDLVDAGWAVVVTDSRVRNRSFG